jgi:Mg-chelatase subunit ChlD
VTDTASPLHIYFLLDRSGSMESIADDVIGGFNSFLAAQRSDGPDALMTLTQFDSQDAHEVLCDSVTINEVADLTPRSFIPRGGTPLYDAMGHLIADATIRAEKRATSGLPSEAILCVTFTDGEENQSREYTRDKIFELIKKREDKGWSFAYLGANQDSYAEAGAIGFAPASIQSYAGDAVGSAAAFSSLSRAVVARRGKMRKGEDYDPADLFEGNKAAEEDLRHRRP